MLPKTRTQLHRLASAREVATTPHKLDLRGITADARRLRNRYRANLRFGLIPRHLTIDDGD